MNKKPPNTSLTDNRTCLIVGLQYSRHGSSSGGFTNQELLIPNLSDRFMHHVLPASLHRIFLSSLRILLLLCLPAVVTLSQVSEKPVPSPAYQSRQFGQQHLAPYLQNKDYLYDRDGEITSEPPNLWERFWLWVIEHLLRPVFRAGSDNSWNWTFYLICAVISIWAILKLTGVNIQGLFTGKPQSGTLRFAENEANIHFIDFDKMIAEAISQGHYRRAVRLFYLKTLKQLSDRELINWRPDKTNHDYLREWKRPDIEPGFRRLTVLFEYICYGDFAIDPDRFEQARQEFRNFEDHLGKF